MDDKLTPEIKKTLSSPSYFWAMVFIVATENNHNTYFTCYSFFLSGTNQDLASSPVQI